MVRLAKDIAKTLGQPDAPLLQAIKAMTVRPYIFEEAGAEDAEVDMRCRFLCQPADTPLFIQPCGKPVLWVEGVATRPRCAEHAYSPPISYNGLHPLKALEVVGEDKYFVGEDGTVYDVEYRPRGAYDMETKRLTLFTVADDE